ncbi:MAG: hypothetical protein ACLTDS_14980 [Bianqueaceae bacterium]
MKDGIEALVKGMPWEKSYIPQMEEVARLQCAADVQKNFTRILETFNDVRYRADIQLNYFCFFLHFEGTCKDIVDCEAKGGS